MSGSLDKSTIRREMRLRRKALSREAKALSSSVVCSKIVSLDQARRSRDSQEVRGTIAVYLASPDEIDLTQAIEELLGVGAALAAPRWNGSTYELARLRSLRDADLRVGPMGILEPKEAAIVRPAEIAVWLVPGLAFTRDGGRLGYGGGWYDRLMAGTERASLKLGIAHAFQVVERLPTEPHDVRLDGVVDDTQDVL